MSYTVSERDLKQINLNEADPVAAILQNVAIILSTRQNSVPLGRDFGLPMRFIDKPIPVAEVMMVAEIEEAIEEYEPRAEVVDITFEADPKKTGRLIPTVTLEINLEEDEEEDADDE